MKNKVLNILLVGLIIGLVGKYIYQLPKYKSGEIAQPIEATLLNGEAFQLNQLKGQYVLLDFWGSWCGPCRSENPKLVRLYSKYKNNNFKIVSIGVERDENRWKKAIKSDQLFWEYHIGQFDRFKSPIVKAYGVKTIPTKYLINPSGEIIGVNQKIVDIDNILSEAFAN